LQSQLDRIENKLDNRKWELMKSLPKMPIKIFGNLPKIH
jgi:hypothetical protein